MIIREARAADLRPLLRLCKKEWTRLGTPHTSNIGVNRFRVFHERSFHIFVLYDGKDLVAGLVGHPLKTDRGAGYVVDILVADSDRPDLLTLVDTVSMYACNIIMSEGSRIVFSEWKPANFCISGVRYGRDILAFDTEDQVGNVRQTGDAQATIANILKRHPEWRLP